MDTTTLRQPTYRLCATFAVVLALAAHSAARLHKSAQFREQDASLEGLPVRGRALVQRREASAADFPYLVSLRFFGLHFCGGVLVRPDLVLTGASCVVSRSDMRHPQVRVGFGQDGDSSDSDEMFETCTTIVHSKFNERQLGLGYDIALLQLNASSAAQPVRLPRGVEVEEDEELTLVGFRRLVPSQRTVEFRTETMEYMSHEDCEGSWGIRLGDEPQKLLCTRSTGGLPPCNGDGGSPLLTEDGTVVGVMSFGPDDCIMVETPSVATRVSEFLDFIDRLGGVEGARSENPGCNA